MIFILSSIVIDYVLYSQINFSHLKTTMTISNKNSLLNSDLLAVNWPLYRT